MEESGFYSLKKLNDEQLKNFFNDAVALSYEAYVEVLDCSKSFRRQSCETFTVHDMIKRASVNNHNVCIDRSIQMGFRKYGEIGYCTITSAPDYFLFVFVTLENLQILVDKYNLKMKLL
jgi:hypothetical protein